MLFVYTDTFDNCILIIYETDFQTTNREIMQEWVDTLRLKLREMKILSPKENLYSKLPEVRPPLLPTRDPTRDPLPLPPPVPAEIVPGVIVNTTQCTRTTASAAASSTLNASVSAAMHVADTSSVEASSSANSDGNERNTTNDGNEATNSFVVVDTLNAITTAPIASTSNTLPQNLIKMLYPLPNFNHQTNALNNSVPDECENGAAFVSETQTIESVATISGVATTINNIPGTSDERTEQIADESVHSLARKFAASVTFDPNTSGSTRNQHLTTISNGSQSAGGQSSISISDSADDTISIDSSVYGIYPTPEPIVIPR